MINPFVGITVNHGIGPFPLGFDTIEFDPYAPAMTSGDSVGNWQVEGLSVVFYGDSGTVGILGKSAHWPLDPSRFTDAKEFAAIYPNSLSRKEAAIDSINGSLVPTLWPVFTPIPEPSSMILVVPIVIAGFLKRRCVTASCIDGRIQCFGSQAHLRQREPAAKQSDPGERIC